MHAMHTSTSPAHTRTQTLNRQAQDQFLLQTSKLLQAEVRAFSDPTETATESSACQPTTLVGG